MTYAKIEDGQVAEYPFNPADMRRPRGDVSVSLPETLTDEMLASHGVYPVEDADQPNITAGQIAVEDTPELVDGVWTQQWSVRSKTSQELADAKDALRSGVNLIKAAKQNGTAPTSFGVVECDTESRNKMNGAVLMAVLALQGSEEFSLSWTMADNTQVDLDAPAMISMGRQVGGYVGACHTHAVGVKKAITEAASFTELNVIDIEAGWPRA